MADLVWVHEDALRATHPVFEVCQQWRAGGLYLGQRQI